MTEFKPEWFKFHDDYSTSKIVHIGVDLAKPGGDKTVRVVRERQSDGTLKIVATRITE
ncbi:MAG: hypothetical protein ACR2QF_11930 [Geminicoccaceae bacterium]